MCNAFSCLIPKTGNEALWKLGVDSHSELARLAGLKDDTLDPKDLRYAKAEIEPANGNYLNPDSWVFTLDESIKPEWYTPECETMAWKAHAMWKKQLYKILVCKPIVNPFKVKPPVVAEKHLGLLRAWALVRDSVGSSVGNLVRDSVGNSVGSSVGNSVGDLVRESVGYSVGYSVGNSVRDSVRDSLYAYIGSFFKLPRREWKYTDAVKADGYPFQAAVDLWEAGLVPSFDGSTWRLHGGKDAKIFYSVSEKQLRGPR